MVLRMTDLPESFLSDMQSLLGPEYESFLAETEKRPCSGLRVNTLKTTPEFIGEKYKKLEKVPWTANGFYIEEESAFTKNPYYYAGLYYIQEPSAMTPASVLGTEPGERILDLCAAPGGKSTEIGACLKGRGILFSNDISSSRAKALLKNLELWGIGNIYLTCEESGKLREVFPEYFDRILVDAPCSGEGMFRKHPAVIKAYLEHGRDFYCPVQERLLNDAAGMLKPGGTIVYSTCTYNRFENEEQIQKFLAAHADFRLDKIAPEKGVSSSDLLPGCIRFFPQRTKAEGHFAARIKRCGTHEPYSVQGKSARGGKNVIPQSVTDFLSLINRNWDLSRILIKDGYVSYLPEDDFTSAHLRTLRTGLLLGQLKNGRFRPSQALAMNLKAEEWNDPLSLARDDPNVIKYLKGETTEAEASSREGIRLLCTDGFPLGFVKQEGMRLKNMYLPGWRWM
jgi:NOL1/NOP2/sun family putative RNA methylase